ncbi:MAG: putative rane-anchored protein [Acidimicrobiaceae bacterium]|nr:putative rane-anchored protein [Acidimicrobiaceae bacterium]
MNARGVKVPEITVYFWILKLLTTAMGEATSDYLVYRINPFVAVAFGGIFFLIAITLQFTSSTYVAWRYWLSVVSVAVFGTMCADALHIQFRVPYAVSSVLFAVILTCVFIFWDRTEHTLSIHTINTPRRELFYWATVLSTFALGTAAGDLTAVTLRLGYLSAGLVFASLIGVTALAYWLLRFSAVAAFWTAYVLTRPVGASFADWTGKTHAVGGLNWGDGPVGACLTVAIVVFVVIMQLTRIDVQRA